MTQLYDPKDEDAIAPLPPEKLWETIDIVARGWDEQHQRAEALDAVARLNASAAEMWQERAERAEAALAAAEVWPLTPGSPISGKVGARMQQYRERAEKAERRAAALSTALRSMARRASFLRRGGAR
ncbi:MULTISPECIES: hypothetical protein [unclassified Saccharopolyspora]|uniref:hypothetical protein n=1 Tax=unclassified Saccharopolyspora TaxID=2646250 RepID=UPI001CD70871|nr:MULTISPECIES: hypothetical protein [unclassified Saccharopolyspora]MCA1185772.1 hypothetical protein [Saccharopolyspora sp. 6T]MCA1191684.1 hypothetical protein [Saccharopolyspora sp. 6V]